MTRKTRKEIYNDYMKSEEWRQKKEQVRERSGGICEKCKRRRAKQCHHITYINFGNEFLYELLDVCIPCHEEIHEKKIYQPKNTKKRANFLRRTIKRLKRG